MYCPKKFAETRIEVLHRLIQAHPLGTLVTVDGAGGLCADHLPFEIGAPSAGAPFGTLRAHVARANPLWRQSSGSEAMVVFQGPQAYITPAWFEDKAINGKVVPTFNYAVVHGHGPLRAIDDRDWLLALLERLTDSNEAGREQPWRVADAPRDYIDKMLAAIVGIEIPLSRIEGKWKITQDHSALDQASIAAGLALQGGAPAEMGALIAARQQV